jgi:hypothetical protein
MARPKAKSAVTDDSLFYLGRRGIKRDGVLQKYTEHELNEYLRCSKDFSYFAENYIKILTTDG